MGNDLARSVTRYSSLGRMDSRSSTEMVLGIGLGLAERPLDVCRSKGPFSVVSHLAGPVLRAEGRLEAAEHCRLVSRVRIVARIGAVRKVVFQLGKLAGHICLTLLQVANPSVLLGKTLAHFGPQLL